MWSWVPWDSDLRMTSLARHMGQSPYNWPEGEESEPRPTPRIPCQSIIRYLLKTAYESGERHRVKSQLSHDRSSASRNLRKPHSRVLRERWVLEMVGRSSLGYSDSSSYSGRSNWKIRRVVQPVGRSRDGANVHHFSLVGASVSLGVPRIESDSF
jgi:hypothetical protein